MTVMPWVDVALVVSEQPFIRKKKERKKKVFCEQ